MLTVNRGDRHSLAATRPGPASRYGIGQVIRPEVFDIATLRSTLWILLLALAGARPVTILSTNGVRHHSARWYRGSDGPASDGPGSDGPGSAGGPGR